MPGGPTTTEPKGNVTMSLDFLTDENGGSPHSSLEDTEKAANWLENTVEGTLISANTQTKLSQSDIRCIVKRALHRFDQKTEGEANHN